VGRRGVGVGVGPPDGVGARCDDQDIFGYMREVAAVSDGLPAQ